MQKRSRAHTQRSLGPRASRPGPGLPGPKGRLGRQPERGGSPETRVQTRRDTSHPACDGLAPSDVSCGVSQAVSITQHQEERSWPGTQDHRGALKEYESVREASLQRL